MSMSVAARREISAGTASARIRRRPQAGLFLAALAVAAVGMGGSASGQSPAAAAPVYGISGDDAVTADNRAQVFTQPAASCQVASPCYLPDPNPAATEGFPVDSYTADTYERPTGPGAVATAVLPALDIVSSQVGADEDYVYFRMNLFGVDTSTGSLPYVYGFELDFDDDPAGEVLVVVTDPGARVGPHFGVAGVVAFWNENSNIFGASARLPDGPGGTADGYELMAFDQGSNRVKDTPGAGDAVQARVAPDRAASLELAVRRPFAEAVTPYHPGVDLSGRSNKAALRANASRDGIDPASFTLHDRFGREEAGSPFPFLRLAPESPACPIGDQALSQAAREALDSGTDADTGVPNPCYPARAIAQFDNTYYTVGTSDPTPTPGPPEEIGGTAVNRQGSRSWVLVLVVPLVAAVALVMVAWRWRRHHRRAPSATVDPAAR